MLPFGFTLRGENKFVSVSSLLVASKSTFTARLMTVPNSSELDGARTPTVTRYRNVLLLRSKPKQDIQVRHVAGTQQRTLLWKNSRRPLDTLVYANTIHGGRLFSRQQLLSTLRERHVPAPDAARRNRLGRRRIARRPAERWLIRKPGRAISRRFKLHWMTARRCRCAAIVGPVCSGSRPHVALLN